MKRKKKAKPIKINNEWRCCICMKPAYYDGRLGDPPILMCDCIPDGYAWPQYWEDFRR